MSRKARAAALGCVLQSIVAGPATGAVLEVPAQFPHIQAAINAALGGDTVLVAEGVYSGYGFRGIDFGGKSILLKSVAGAAETVLAHGGSPGFYFHSGEGSDTVVDGFTSTWAATTDCGAGVLCTNESAPTFRNCLIAHNSAIGMVGGKGAGICCAGGASPTFIGCTITANEAHSDLPPDGGGIFCWGDTSAHTSTYMKRCIIWGNCGGDVVASDFSTISLECCAVDPEEVFGGERVLFIGENVLEDPLFCSPQPCTVGVADPAKFHLFVESPCLPWVSPCGELIGAFPVGCPTTTTRDEHSWSDTRSKQPVLATPWPQPAVTCATLSLTVPNSGPVLVSVFDLTGALVRQLLDDVVVFGRHEITWDLRNKTGQVVPPGVYWIRCQRGSTQVAGRVIIVR